MSEPKKDMKPFEYMELKAIASFMLVDAINGSNIYEKPQEVLENKIEEIINIRWNSPDKNEEGFKK